MKFLHALLWLICAIFTPITAWPENNRTLLQIPSTGTANVDVRKSGAIYDIEFVGNASRLNAFLGVSNSSEITHDETRFSTGSSKDYVQTHYPFFRAIRIGNLFFGFECLGADFKELAVLSTDGSLHYQFEETIQLIDELLRSGLKPRFALTGIPLAMVPKGETGRIQK